jgi:hypothetical protein
MTSRIGLAITSFALVILSSALMQAQVLRIGGVTPNVLLVSLIVIGFFSENVIFYTLVVLVGALFGRATPIVLDPYALATTGIVLAAFIFGQKMVWPSLFGVGSIVSIATVLTYLLVSPQTLWGHPEMWLLELVYNIGIGLLMFEIMRLRFGNNIRR